MPTRRARRFVRPARIRVSLFGDPAGSIPLPLPARRTWPVGLMLGAMFAVFAWIAVRQVGSIRTQGTDTVFDVMVLLFQGFWVVGWSVGVVILFLLTVLLLFYRESAYVTNGRLVHVPRLGPIRVFLEYDLARVRHPRVVSAGKGQGRIEFDYRGIAQGLGNDMPRAEAEHRVRAIRSALDALDVTDRSAPEDVEEDRRVGRASPPPSPSPAPRDAPARGSSVASTLALVGANLVPLGGVLLLGWDLGQIMTLFWAENAVVGFYSLLRLGVFAKWKILIVGPVFVAHFGGFMAGHFIFVYYLFVRGIAATGPEAGAFTALADLFAPLWPALLALFLSHGVSFAANFVRRREYATRELNDLMAGPYKRVVVLHVTLIFGGWAILLLRSPLPALVFLIALKTVVDLRAHRKEHRADGGR